MSGYTALNEALDPEEVEPIMSRIKSDAIRIVEELGGIVNQFVGDEVMALFGIPVAHGDDAIRAVVAALRLHEAVGPLAAEVGARTGMKVALHTAVNTGLLLGRRRDDREGRYTVTGDTVNTCARLLSLAGPDEVVLGAQTQRLVASRFVTEELPAARVKGKALPLVPFRVVSERPRDAAGAHAFVGRGPQLTMMRERIAEIVAGGRGQVVRVRGEAGIGKSALAHEIRRAAESAGFSCWDTQALGFGVGRGRDAVSRLVANLLDVDASVFDETERREATETALSTGLIDEGLRPFLEELLALPLAPELRAVFEAMDGETRERGRRAVLPRLVVGRCREGPALVTFEDVHWADDASLDALDALAGLAPTLPLLLLTTARPVASSSTSRPNARGAPSLTIDLGPLEPDEALAMARELGLARGSVVDDCVARAAGHPLFLEQLLRSADLGDAGVPETIESIVLARVDKLPGPARSALQAASVLGERFAREALQAVWSATDAARNEDGLGSGGALDVLVERGLLHLDGADVVFSHALVQEAVYGALLRAQCRELNLRASVFYQGRDPALTAEHLERAEDPAAAGAYLDAANGRMRQLDHTGATRLVERGLRLPATPAIRHELFSAKGRIEHDLGSSAASIESFGAALDLAERDDQRCRAWLGLAAALRLRDAYADALAMLDRAEAVAARDALDEELAQIYHLRGNVLFPRGELAGCLHEHERSLAIARRAGLVEIEAAALGGVGDACYLRGDMPAVETHVGACVELCRAHGLVRAEVANRPMLGWARAHLGDFEGALADGSAAANLARRIHHIRAEVVALGLVGWIHLERAELEPAEITIARFVEAANALASGRFVVQAMVWSAYLAAARGDRARAAELVRRAADARRPEDASFNGAFTLGALARLTDDPHVRAASLEAGEALLHAGTAIHNHLWFYRDAIEAALAARDWDATERRAAALVAAPPVPLPWTELVAARARALAAVGRDARDPVAVAALRDVRGRLERAGFASYLPAIDRALRASDTSPP